MQVTAPSSGTYNIPYKKYTAQVFLTAINTAPNVVPAGFVGKLYTMTSNKLVLDYGDSLNGIPAANAGRLGIRFDSEGPYGANANNLDLVFLKNGLAITPASDFGAASQTTRPYFGTRTNTGREENININSTVADNATYTINIFAKNLILSPVNMPYRFMVRFPDEKVRVYAGVLNGLTVGTPATAIPVLQIIKTTPPVNGVPTADYQVTSLP